MLICLTALAYFDLMPRELLKSMTDSCYYYAANVTCLTTEPKSNLLDRCCMLICLTALAYFDLMSRELFKSMTESRNYCSAEILCPTTNTKLMSNLLDRFGITLTYIPNRELEDTTEVTIEAYYLSSINCYF